MNINVFNCCNVNIKIYDTCNNLLIDDIIYSSSYYSLCKGIYILKMYLNNNFISSYVLAHYNDRDCYYLFPCCNLDKTFCLYDYFYNGLKIQRGELILGT